VLRAAGGPPEEGLPLSRQKVLVADDEETIRMVFSELLQHEGLEVATAFDGQNALEVFAEFQPDLMLLDVMMPRLNGFQVCEQLKSDPVSRLTPIVMITASSAKQNRVRGLEAGADDFLAKPVDRSELTARVRSLLRIKRYTDELESAEAVLMALARSIEGKDPYTEGHCERLSVFSVMLGEALGLPEEEIVALRRGGIVHDIGKISVPDAILLKKGRLDDSELKVMREHPIIGERICRGLRSFALVLPIIRHHHEKQDGTGYPDGLSGEDVPLTARILQIVDVYDALRTERPYKPSFSEKQVLEIMQQEVDAGWWDPDIFRVFRDEVLAKQGELIAT
jgi:putative two-component system response regulator